MVASSKAVARASGTGVKRTEPGMEPGMEMELERGMREISGRLRIRILLR
jgi:hypothetical protein